MREGPLAPSIGVGLSTPEMPLSTLVGAFSNSVGLCSTGQVSYSTMLPRAFFPPSSACAPVCACVRHGFVRDAWLCHAQELCNIFPDPRKEAVAESLVSESASEVVSSLLLRLQSPLRG